MNSFELERLVSRRLRALPTPRAPHTLLPRVLAAARAWAERPWYTREWFTWPWAWQLGSAALLLLTIAAGVGAAPAIRSWLSASTSSVASTIEVDLLSLTERFQVSTAAVRVIWRALIQPFLPYARVIIMLMCGACATVVFALNRVVFGRVLHS